MPPVFQSEHFKVLLQDADTMEYSSVTVEVGIEGMKIHDSNERRVLRIYPMKDISRWSLSGNEMITIYVKTKVDIEERQVQFRGDEKTIQSLLDSLTCASHQMIEVIEGREAEAASLFQSSSKRKQKSEATVVDDVEFWRSPEKEGWMYSKGEVIKTWRRRWFVLKSGFLFRFLSNDLDSSSKPRGIVDLSSVTDITEGNSVTGKPHSIKLSTATGYVCYGTDSDIEMVEWISALDTAHTKIVRRVAGVEEEEEKTSKSKSRIKWAEEKLRNYESGNRSGSDLVSVVGYDAFSAATAPPDTSANQPSLNYSDIDGISGVVNSHGSGRMVRVNYGDYGRSNTSPQLGQSTAVQQPAVYPRANTVPSYAGYTAPVNPQQHYTPSFLDQTPQQTPTYPSFQSISVPNYRMQVPNVIPQTPPPNQMHAWQVYRTPDGRVYYHNRTTGKTQWERPPEIVM